MPKDKAHVLGMFARCELTAEESAMNGADHAHNSSPSAAVVVRAAARLVAKHLFEHGVKQVKKNKEGERKEWPERKRGLVREEVERWCTC